MKILELQGHMRVRIWKVRKDVLSPLKKKGKAHIKFTILSVQFSGIKYTDIIAQSLPLSISRTSLSQAETLPLNHNFPFLPPPSSC